MIRSLFSAATGMMAQQLNLDVIANNLANVNTSGFKKSRADFQDLMYQMVEEPGTQAGQQGNSPTGIQVGLGVKPAAVGKIYSQGDFQSTSNPLDVAIEGDGFFEVIMPDGQSAYTRAGAMKLDETGNMVTADGYQVNPTITIPNDTIGITIAEDGMVSVKQPGNPTPSQVGQLQTVRFQNPGGLKAMGKNMFQETEASGSPTVGIPGENGYGTLSQGYLENSNVSVVEEVVQMVTSQRAYEANSKVIQTADQLLTQALNVKR
ncbi:MAG: flagellar basal-body rod protein FlgG [Deltaproteobacteria bacterium]|nr:flagellar basal-body rod protein FlgG [Deltaproteobacteria bacterium]